MTPHDAPLTQRSEPTTARIDADPRRQHPAWDFLCEGRVELLDGLAALAERWRNVDVRHELELALFLVALMRELDALLGEHACRVWYALLELADAGPAWRAPSLERVLSPDADRRIAAAMELLRAPDGVVDEWGGGPEVRARLAEVGEALRELAMGRPVPDLLNHRRITVTTGTAASPLALAEPHLRLVP